ncbi:MAG: ABC-2 family transporter protein [Nanoarchaeota archaeon]|nr:ABC-2 family transporter protein [Nanoarchaeota archaeon]
MSKLKLIWKFFMINVRQNLEYRLNATIGTIAIALTNIPSIIFFWIIFSNIPTLNGWGIGEILFMVGIGALAHGTFHTFFSGVSGWQIEQLIRQGNMDRILLKPLSVIPHLAMEGSFDVDGLGDIISGLIIIFITSNMLGLQWNIFNSSLLVLFVLSSAVIIASFHLIIGTLSFWVTRSGALIDLFYTVMRFGEYPLDIYNLSTKIMLTVIIPVGFINYYPAQIFLGKGLWVPAAYLTPVVAIIMYAIAHRFWDYGLKHYTSTGS